MENSKEKEEKLTVEELKWAINELNNYGWLRVNHKPELREKLKIAIEQLVEIVEEHFHFQKMRLSDVIEYKDGKFIPKQKPKVTREWVASIFRDVKYWNAPPNTVKIVEKLGVDYLVAKLKEIGVEE